MEALWIVVGALLAGPLWVAVSVWAMRRIWRNARRLTARARVQEHFIELGQLVGGLAHEIKNPLSTIQVNLKLLAEDLAHRDDEEHRRLARRLQSVQSEADRLKGTLDDFLRFAGKYEITLASTDLRRLIEELLDFFTPQADASGVLLRSSLPSEPIFGRVDSNLLKQAVLNLMINALQAMPHAGELLIRLSANRSDAILEVIDTGPGISQEELKKVFQVYYSTKIQGSGLGLPTSRRIVREHGGNLRIESEPGKGTRAVLTLPLEKK